LLTPLQRASGMRLWYQIAPPTNQDAAHTKPLKSEIRAFTLFVVRQPAHCLLLNFDYDIFHLKRSEQRRDGAPPRKSGVNFCSELSPRRLIVRARRRFGFGSPAVAAPWPPGSAVFSETDMVLFFIGGKLGVFQCYLCGDEPTAKSLRIAGDTRTC
jgi:hypothetical protein